MSRARRAALEEAPAEHTETVTVTCTTCSAHVAAADIADHVCDPSAANGAGPLAETVLDPTPETETPRPVYATAPVETWAPWVIDELEQLATGDIGTATHAVVLFSEEKPPMIAGVNDSHDAAVTQAGSIAERGILQGELRVFAIDAIRDAASTSAAAADVADTPEPGAIDAPLDQEPPVAADTEYVDVEVDLDAVAAEAAGELGIALDSAGSVVNGALDEVAAEIAVAAGVTDSVEQGQELLAEDAPADGRDTPENPDTGQLFPTPRPEIARDLRDPDELVLNFSGAVPMERGNPNQVEFFNSLQTGDEVELTLTIRVGTEALRARLDKEREYVKDRVLAKSLVVSDVHFEAE